VKVTFHEDALSEYVHAVAWYERDYPGRGERFAAAVELVLAAIAEQPGAFPARLVFLHEPRLRQHSGARRCTRKEATWLLAGPMSLGPDSCS
jgi:hypothetical protein